MGSYGISQVKDPRDRKTRIQTGETALLAPIKVYRSQSRIEYSTSQR